MLASVRVSGGAGSASSARTGQGVDQRHAAPGAGSPVVGEAEVDDEQQLASHEGETARRHWVPKTEGMVVPASTAELHAAVAAVTDAAKRLGIAVAAVKPQQPLPPASSLTRVASSQAQAGPGARSRGHRRSARSGYRLESQRRGPSYASEPGVVPVVAVTVEALCTRCS